MGSVLWVVKRWGRRVQGSVHASPPPPHTCPRQFILLDVSPIKRHLYFVNLCNFQMLLLSVRQRLSPPRADRVCSGILHVLISYLNIVQKCTVLVQVLVHAFNPSIWETETDGSL